MSGRTAPIVNGNLSDYRTCAHCGEVTVEPTIRVMEVPYGRREFLPGRRARGLLEGRAIRIEASLCVHCYRPFVVMSDEQAEVGLPPS